MGLTLHDILKNIISEQVSNDEVLDAIHNRNYVRIKYDDTMPSNGRNPKGSRVIQPFALGTTKKGYPVVRAFQVNGNSRRGAPKWKYFRLDRIKSWKKLKKTFNTTPDEIYGVYNTIGDESMLSFIDNVKFDDGNTSPLEKMKAVTQDIKNAPKVSIKNTSGPISANQQWKKNVFTSQPNNRKYADYAKNVEMSDEKDKNFWDEYDLAQREVDKQNQQGPIDNSYDDDHFDIDEVDFDENNFLSNRNRR